MNFVQALFATREIEHFRKLFISSFLLLFGLLFHFDEMCMSAYLQSAGNIFHVHMLPKSGRISWWNGKYPLTTTANGLWNLHTMHTPAHQSNWSSWKCSFDRMNWIVIFFCFELKSGDWFIHGTVFSPLDSHLELECWRFCCCCAQLLIFHSRTS